MQDKIIKIEVWGGCVTDVKNLPRGWKYEIIDRDVQDWEKGPEDDNKEV